MSDVLRNYAQIKNYVKYLMTLGVAILLSSYSSHKTAKVSVTITNLRNADGQVNIAIYENNDQFQDDDHLKKLHFSKQNTKNNTLKVEFELKPGTYGLAMLDDENKNNELDFGWVLPEEGYGFSNYYHTGMTKPHFDKFSFVVSENGGECTIKVKYF